MLKCQDVAHNHFSKVTFIGVEWFCKATIAFRHHIYKRLKPHTDKKVKKEKVWWHHNGYKAYTSKTYQIHRGNGTRLAYPPPPPFLFMVTPLISWRLTPILCWCSFNVVGRVPILTFDFIHPQGNRSRFPIRHIGIWNVCCGKSNKHKIQCAYPYNYTWNGNITSLWTVKIL